MYKVCIYNYDEAVLNSQNDLGFTSGEYEPGESWRAGLVTTPPWIAQSESLILTNLNDGMGGNSTPYLGGLNSYVGVTNGIADAEYSGSISYTIAPAEYKNEIAANESLSSSSGSSSLDLSSGNAGLLFDEEHGLCIHDDETVTNHDKLVEPTLKMSDSAAGTFEFTIPLNNVGYGKMKRMVTIVSVFQNHREIFSGRVLSEEDDFWGRQKICVEGELAYLNDTTQPPAVINGTPREYIQVLLDRHNAKVQSTAPFKQFKLGVVIVSYEKLTKAYGDAIEWMTNFESTLDLINQFITDVEGHMEIVKSGGVRLLNIYDDWPRTSNQTISFGVNLLDFTQKYDMSDLATVLIPLGKLEDQTAKGEEIIFETGDWISYDEEFGAFQRNKVSVMPQDGFAIYDASCFCTGVYEVFRDQNIIDHCKSLTFRYSSILPSGFIEFAVFDGNGNCMSTSNSDGRGKVNEEVSIQNTARWVFVSSYYDSGSGRGISPFLQLVENQSYSEEYWTYQELTRDEIVNPNTNPPTTATVVYDRKPVKENRDVYVDIVFTNNLNWGWLIREHNLINDYGTVDYTLGLRYINEQYATYGPIAVSEGDRYYYSSRCDEKFFMYAFVDDEGVLKGSKTGQECFDSTQHNDVEDELVTAPRGATRLYFTGIIDRFHLWKYNDLYDKMDKSLTVETAVVNGEPYGSYYVINEAGVRNFGWIEKIVKFDDVTDPTDLLEKAQTYLTSEQFDQLEINITALDLAEMGVNVDSLHVLDSVRCVSEPHGLDKYYPIREIDLPLDKPDGAKYFLGDDLKLTLTDTTWDANADLQAQIEAIPSKESVLDAAKEQATAVMHQWTRGYVTFAETDQYGTCIYISDSEDYTTARRLWLWSLNGLGYSKDGGETFDLAITMDGAIVADFITAGQMSADRVRTGKLIDVNAYNWWDLSNGEFVIGHNHAWVETRGLDEHGNVTTLKRESLEAYAVNQYKIFKELFGVPDSNDEVRRRLNGIRGMMTKISDQEEIYEYNIYISASQISSGVLMSDTDSFFFDLHNGTMVSTAKYRGFTNSNGTVTETGPVFDKFLQFLYCSVLGFTGGSYEPTTFDPYTGEVVTLGGIVGITDPNSGEHSSAELNGALDLAQTYPDGKHVTLSSKNSIILSYGDTFYVEKGEIVTGEIEYAGDGDLRDGYVVNSTPRDFIFGETELFDGDGVKFQFDIDVRLNNSVVIGYDKNEYENPLPNVYIPISSGSLEVRGNTTLGRASAVYETNELRTLKKKKQAYNPATGNMEYIYSTRQDPNDPSRTIKEYVYEYYDKPYAQKHYLDKVQINGDVNVTGTIKTSSIEIDDTISLNHVIAKKCIKVGQDYAGGFFDDCVWETDAEMLEIQGYDSATASKKANSTNVFCGVNLFYDSAAFYGSGNGDSAITGYGIIEYLLCPHKNNNATDYENMSTQSTVKELEAFYSAESDIQALVQNPNPISAIKKYRLVTEGGILTVGDSKFFGAFAVSMSPNHVFQVFGVSADYTNIQSNADIMNYDTTLVDGKAKVIYMSLNQTHSGYGIYDILLNGFVKITCKLTLDAPLEVNKTATFNGSVYINGLSFFDDEAEFHDAICIVKVTGTGAQQTIEDIITLNKDSDGSIKVKGSSASSVISITRTASGKEYGVKAFADGTLETTGNATLGGDIIGKGLFKLTKSISNVDTETIVIANSGSITITDTNNSPTDADSEYILVQNSTGLKYVKLLSDGVVRASGSGIFSGSLQAGGSIKIHNDTNDYDPFVVTYMGSVTITDNDSSSLDSTSQSFVIQNVDGSKYVKALSNGIIYTTGAGKFGGMVTASMLKVIKTVNGTDTDTFKVTNNGDLTANSALIEGDTTIVGGTLAIKQYSNSTPGFSIDYQGLLTCNSATIKGDTTIIGGTFSIKRYTNSTPGFSIDYQGLLTCNSATINGDTTIVGGSFSIKRYASSDPGFSIDYRGIVTCNGAVINGNAEIYDSALFVYATSNGGLSKAIKASITNSGAISGQSATINGSITGASLTINGAASVSSLQVNNKTPALWSDYKPPDEETTYANSLNASGVMNMFHLYVNGTKRITSGGTAYLGAIYATGTLYNRSWEWINGKLELVDRAVINSSREATFSHVLSDTMNVANNAIQTYSKDGLTKLRAAYGLMAGWDGYSYNSYIYGTLFVNGASVSSSDRKLKHDIGDVAFKSLWYVDNIRAKSFRWNSNNELVPAGFIAQDVEVIDETYNDEKDYSPVVVLDTSNGMKSIDYNKLTAILWEAVHELSKKVDELTAKLEAQNET